MADVPDAKRSALRRLGPFKNFYEKVYPFSLAAVRCYGEQDDVVCVPSLEEHRDFDAEVRSPVQTLGWRLPSPAIQWSITE